MQQSESERFNEIKAQAPALSERLGVELRDCLPFELAAGCQPEATLRLLDDGKDRFTDLIGRLLRFKQFTIIADFRVYKESESCVIVRARFHSMDSMLGCMRLLDDAAIPARAGRR